MMQPKPLFLSVMAAAWIWYIFRGLALCYDCLETWKLANENDDHINVRCIDQNARESAVQSLYGVKYDPHQPPAHFLYRDDMSNSRYIVHIGSYIFRMRPLHHWLCGILEQFHLVCAIAKKFGQGSWNPHIWVHFQVNTVATLVPWYTSLIRYASHFHSTLPSRLKSSRSALTKGLPQLQKMFTRFRTWMKRLAFGPRNDRIYQSRVCNPCSS